MNGFNPYCGQFKPLQGVVDLCLPQMADGSETVNKPKRLVNRCVWGVPRPVRDAWAARLRELLIENRMLFPRSTTAAAWTERRAAFEKREVFAKMVFGGERNAGYVDAMISKGILPNQQQLEKAAAYFGMKPDELIPEQDWRWLSLEV